MAIPPGKAQLRFYTKTGVTSRRVHDPVKHLPHQTPNSHSSIDPHAQDRQLIRQDVPHKRIAQGLPALHIKINTNMCRNKTGQVLELRRILKLLNRHHTDGLTQ